MTVATLTVTKATELAAAVKAGKRLSRREVSAVLLTVKLNHNPALDAALETLLDAVEDTL